MKKFFRELYNRWRAPLNTWWYNALVIFGPLGAMAASIVDLLPLILNDQFVPDSWKDYGRIFYSVCLAIAAAAKTTKKDKPSEFDDKLREAQEQETDPPLLDYEIIAYQNWTETETDLEPDGWRKANGEVVDYELYEIGQQLGFNSRGKLSKAIFKLKSQNNG